MIPVFQTRVAIETFGNCFEACLASILELPLAAVPDRADYIDADAWADAVQSAQREGRDLGATEVPQELDGFDRDLGEWLAERGLGLIEFEIGRVMSEQSWLERARDDHLGYWIGVYRQGDGWSHAMVGYGDTLVHNPTRGISATRGYFGELHTVNLLTAADPAKIVRRLGPELLPDVVGEIESLLRDLVDEPDATAYSHALGLPVRLDPDLPPGQWELRAV